VSPAYETIWGRSCESLYRDTCSGWRPKIRRPQAPEPERELTKGEFDEEFRIVELAAKVRWVLAEFSPFSMHAEKFIVLPELSTTSPNKAAEELCGSRGEALLTCEQAGMGVGTGHCG
jgi:hypothetical protein